MGRTDESRHVKERVRDSLIVRRESGEPTISVASAEVGQPTNSEMDSGRKTYLRQVMWRDTSEESAQQERTIMGSRGQTPDRVLWL